MDQSGNKTHNLFAPWKVMFPVAIGLAVVVLMFLHDARSENIGAALRDMEFTGRTMLFILFAALAFAGREFGYMWRFRVLTDNELRWKDSFEVDMLCEFTSCVTPSAVGGSALAMVFMSTKGIEFGRATTLMLTTLFLDELFFVVFCPIIALLTPAGALFESAGMGLTLGIRLTFWIIYALLAAYTLLLFCGIIWKPNWIRRLLGRLFSMRWLRRWQDKAESIGVNMVTASKALRSKDYRFWLKAFGATSLSWISRFLVVNAIFFGFLATDDPMQWVIFAREFVIWVILMVSPTPGGSGLGEWLFSNYYGDLVPTAAMALVMAIIWRLLTYYLYLLAGACIVPGWLKRSVRRKR